MRCKCGHHKEEHFAASFECRFFSMQFGLCPCRGYEPKAATDTTEVMPVAVPAPELEATGPTQASLAKPEETVHADEQSGVSVRMVSEWKSSPVLPSRFDVMLTMPDQVFVGSTSAKWSALLSHLEHEALGYGERGRLILELIDDIKRAMATTVVDRLVD